MKTLADSNGLFARFIPKQIYPASFHACARLFVAALMLVFAGHAHAVITVGLAIENDLDSNGNITVLEDSKLKVSYSVVEDSDKDLHKNDKIQLLRVSNDSIVDSTTRGKKKSGSVSLKVKNSVNEELYVRYLRKNGTQVIRISHPSDPGFTALQSIAKATLADLTIEQSIIRSTLIDIADQLNTSSAGVVAIPGSAFRNENNSPAQETQCQLTHSSGGSYYRNVAGATVADCDAWAAIQLPQGRTMTELSCTAVDNSGANSNAISFQLRRISLVNGATRLIYSTAATADDIAPQQVSDNTANPDYVEIDNNEFAYMIWAIFSDDDFSNLGSNGSIIGCRVSYQ